MTAHSSSSGIAPLQDKIPYSQQYRLMEDVERQDSFIGVIQSWRSHGQILHAQTKDAKTQIQPPKTRIMPARNKAGDISSGFAIWLYNDEKPTDQHQPDRKRYPAQLPDPFLQALVRDDHKTPQEEK